MKIENQVCTLKQAKKLKALGVAQESFMYWEELHPVKDCATERLQVHFNTGHPISNGVVKDQYSAYTVAELGEMFPLTFIYEDDKCFASSEKFCLSHKWITGICTVASPNKSIEAKKYFADHFEAHARAQNIIYLLEKGIVTVDTVNNNLLTL